MKKLVLLLLCCQLYSFTKADFSLEDVIASGTFSPKYVAGFNTIEQDTKYVVRQGNKIVSYSMESGDELETLFDASDADLDGFNSFSFSSDYKQILIYTKRQRLYRRSFTASLYLWHIKDKRLTKVGESLEVPSFSPDNQKLAYIFQNNLFSFDLKSGKHTQVTTDGEVNKIINGKPDWVYEEEFSYNKAYVWSADSEHLVYAKFDETAVKVFNMTLFAGKHPTHPTRERYPENYQFKYPKAGEQNAKVSVHSYHLATGKNKEVQFSTSLKDAYLPRIYRTAKTNTVALVRANRAQNKFELLAVNLENEELKTELLLAETNSRFVDEDFLRNLHFEEQNKSIYFLSERSGYKHIYKYNTAEEEAEAITEGNWDVTEFHGIDGDYIYYSAAETAPTNRNLYRIEKDGDGKEILTPNLAWNSVSFTKSMKYFINSYSTTQKAPTVDLHQQDGSLVKNLAKNNWLDDKVADLPRKELFQFETRDGIELNGWMIKPTNFNPKKKYPVLMTQYSGPNSQQVKNEFSFNWYNYLAQQGYLVVCVDGRGTGGRGEDFRKITYLQLGKFETIDQVATAAYLADLDYVDGERIGIWGWSYGGFMVLNAMQQGDGIFKCGIATAPVTDWKFYDSIYTERYMLTPQQNPEGYAENSPLKNAFDHKGSLLICSGTADDNVHLQNTLEYCEALVQARKLFEMHTYTNRNHSIYGGNTRLHLYETFTDFLERRLK